MKKVFCIPPSTTENWYYSDKTIGEILFSNDKQAPMSTSNIKVGDYMLFWKSDSNQYHMHFGSCLPCKGLVAIFKENDTIRENGTEIIRHILNLVSFDRNLLSK